MLCLIHSHIFHSVAHITGWLVGWLFGCLVECRSVWSGLPPSINDINRFFFCFFIRSSFNSVYTLAYVYMYVRSFGWRSFFVHTTKVQLDYDALYTERQVTESFLLLLLLFKTPFLSLFSYKYKLCRRLETKFFFCFCCFLRSDVLYAHTIIFVFICVCLRARARLF